MSISDCYNRSTQTNKYSNSVTGNSRQFAGIVRNFVTFPFLRRLFQWSQWNHGKLAIFLKWQKSFDITNFEWFSISIHIELNTS